ncbi:endonuclease MutS2 [Listeria kieliensis]|uniref:Mannonate oxidoreductase n=1 Tax=Listeria kieliensis TaxID=1621700 RepID=A0A3D8TT13_9LIST|nr:endonuclease MutS2 [Listeria kieliensis]RDX02111.1 mannonate oxidoreductase [Listeria kieliensis]
MNTLTFDKLEYPQLTRELAENCVSDAAKEKARGLTPYKNKRTIEAKLEETSEARKILDSGQNLPLFGVSKMKQTLTKLEKSFEMTPVELMEIADFLRSTRRIKQFLEKNRGIAPMLAEFAQSIQSFIEIEDAISQAIRNGEVDNAASSNLRKTRKLLEENQAKTAERLDKFMKNPENKAYIQEFFVTRKNDRDTIPIKASFQKFVRGTVIEVSNKGTTVFIEPETIAKLSAIRVNLKAEEQAEIYQILAALSGAVLAEMDGIKHNLEVLTEFDFIFAKGKLSRQMEATRPFVNERGQIKLKQVKHPFLAMKAAVPLDFSIGEDYRGLIITGPNAGGKTVVLKTVGLLTLMMMAGLHVPAAEHSELAIFERVFADIGDNQSLENALSTFSSHMQNAGQILAQVNEKTLVLFDEIGSGTEPNEGAALAIAILEECYRRGGITVASTHYEAIKRYGGAHPDFINARMAFDAETLAPKYRLIIGESGESNALYIAEKMNIDRKVLQKAQYYMEESDYALEKLSFQSKNASHEAKETSQPLFEKGDRVRLLETDETGLVFSSDQGEVIVYVDGEKRKILPRRLSLLASRAELYPVDYDLNQLFTSFQERKEQHDFARGSKKALRRVQKEIKKSLDSE